MIRLINERGPVDGAVFDASQISPEYAGIRCGVSIGSNGGIVCDAVECERPFSTSVIRNVATETVVLLDASRFEGAREFRLLDADGNLVEVDGEDDPYDPLDMDLAGADDTLIAELRERLPAPWLLIAVIAAIVSAAAWMRYTSGDVEAIRWGFLAVCLAASFVIYNVIQLMRIRKTHDALVDEMEILIDRELERRRALDRAMERHGSQTPEASRPNEPATV